MKALTNTWQRIRRVCPVIAELVRRFSLCWISLVFLLTACPGWAGGTLTYYGRITDGDGNPVSVPTSVTFSFRTAEVGGYDIGYGFNDQDMVTPDSNGIFSTEIGDEPNNRIPSITFVHDSVWLLVYFAGAERPRVRISSVGYAINAIPSHGESYVILRADGSEVENGTELVAGYNRARMLVPNGQALSATNRATVLVPPGRYDLGTSQLVMDTEFVDVVGLSSTRENQHVFGTANGPGTGVLRQTGNNVRIENLTLECTLTTGVVAYTSQDPAAYFPDSATTDTVVRNCAFLDQGGPYDGPAWGMRLRTAYPGTYEDCVAGHWAFGGYMGIASGSFSNCTGGWASFAGVGVASGTFRNCTGGDFAFAGSNGLASGTFTDCVGGDYSYGYSGTASGTFTRCIGGESTFGYAGTASGRFAGCRGGDDSFARQGIASGVFVDCTAGFASFGTGGSPTGTFIRCTSGESSFGAEGGGNADNGKFYYCVGGAFSFATGGTPAPVFRYCVKGGAAFP